MTKQILMKTLIGAGSTVVLLGGELFVSYYEKGQVDWLFFWTLCGFLLLLVFLSVAGELLLLSPNPELQQVGKALLSEEQHLEAQKGELFPPGK